MIQPPKLFYSILTFTILAALPTLHARAASFITQGTIHELTPSSASIDHIDITVFQPNTSITIDALAWELNLPPSTTPTFTDLNADSQSTFGDTYLLILNASNTLLASNDDAPAGQFGADGSISTLDSYLTYNFTNTGDYSIYIGQSTYTLNNALNGANNINGLYNINASGFITYSDTPSTDIISQNHFDWSLTLSSPSPEDFDVTAVHTIPVPSALWAGVAAFTAISLFRRHKK